MNKQTCIVTGSSSGLGKGTATLLARRRENIVLLSRENDRGRETLNELQEINKEGRVDWIPCDLSSMKSVRKFVEEFSQKYSKLNLLFNCAGMISLKRNLTREGLESMFATNYLGHFLLTKLLYESLKAGAPSRVITVSGRGHKKSWPRRHSRHAVNFNNLHKDPCFNFVEAAKESMLARIMLSYQLAEKWEKDSIYATSISPGLTSTGLTDHLPLYARVYYRLLKLIGPTQSPEEAAGFILQLAFDMDEESINGNYFEVDRRRKILRKTKSSKISYDREQLDYLWSVSAALTESA